MLLIAVNIPNLGLQHIELQELSIEEQIKLEMEKGKEVEVKIEETPYGMKELEKEFE